MELVQNDFIINSNSSKDAEGLITFTPKGFKIVVNGLRFSSFKEFIQTTSDQHKKSSKENLKVSKDFVLLIHLIKYFMNLFTFRFTFTN